MLHKITLVLKPRGASGRLVSRAPVASKIALPKAGARPTSGVSPAPENGRSLRSRRTTCISGTSRKRGTRYRENRAFYDAAIRKLNRFEKSAAEAHDVRSDNLIA